MRKRSGGIVAVRVSSSGERVAIVEVTIVDKRER